MKKLKLYKLSQDINEDYDTYDSCIVCSTSAKKAVRIHPDNNWSWEEHRGYDVWVPEDKISAIKIEYLGLAGSKLKEGVILSSFNAG